MSNTHAAQQLRERAVALRAFAERIETLELHSLRMTAGATTWVGPSPQACLDDLDRIHRLLHSHADTLRATARRFARTADELDALAAVRPLVH